jgi:hypothetical protein
MTILLDKPAHRLSQYSGYTNWGFGYGVFEVIALKYHIPLYFNRPYSLAFVLAKLLRWKRTYFYAIERFSVNLAPTRWYVKETLPICTAAWTVPGFHVEINIGC